MTFSLPRLRACAARYLPMLLLVLGVAGLLASAAMKRDQAYISDTTRYINNEDEQKVELPNLVFSGDDSTVYYSISLQVPSEHTPSQARLFIDDCLQLFNINDQPVPSNNKTCRFPLAQSFNLASLMHPGENILNVELSNAMGSASLDFMMPYPPEILARIIGISCMVSFVLLRLGAARQLGAPVLCMLHVSLMLMLYHLSCSSYLRYSHDIDGHLEYIRILAQGMLPEPTGWQSHYPPVYYALGAAVYKLAGLLGVDTPMAAVRYLSLACYGAFLVISLMTMRQFFPIGKWFALSAALLLFWPEGYIIASRISNDVAILPLMAATLYALVRWNNEGSLRWLHAGIAAAFASLTIKSSGIIAVGAAGLLCAGALYTRRATLRQLLPWKLCLFILLCLGLNFGRTLYFNITRGADIPLLINITPEEYAYARLSTRPFGLLTFSYTAFVEQTFWADIPQIGLMFWNTFFKSLLLGEWSWAVVKPAQWLSALMVVLLAFPLAQGLLIKRGANWRPLLPLLVMTACMIGAMLRARLEIPWSPTTNARYVFAIIGILPIFFTRSLMLAQQQGRMVLVGIGWLSAVLFCYFSVELMVNEHLNFLRPVP